MDEDLIFNVLGGCGEAGDETGGGFCVLQDNCLVSYRDDSSSSRDVEGEGLKLREENYLSSQLLSALSEVG